MMMMMMMNKKTIWEISFYILAFGLGFSIGENSCEAQDITPMHETVIPKKTDFFVETWGEKFMLDLVYEGQALQLFGLLEREGQLVRFRDAYGRTILMHAVALGDIDVVATLLQYGANMSDRDVFGRTPFMYMNDAEYDQDLHILLSETWSNQRLGR